MPSARRLLSGALLSVLLCNVACNDDCDERCISDHDDCISNAGNDDEKKSRCEAEFDQCRGICASEPVDTNPPR